MDFDFNKKIEQEHNHYSTPRTKPRKGFYVLGFFIAVIIIFSLTVIISGDSSESWVSKIPLIGKLLGVADNKDLKGEEEDRINVLLLGMGGKGHDGGYLTDTIMLASLKPSTKQVALFSIPRDLSIPMENGSWQKVNSINAYAEKNEEEGGRILADNLSRILELPIHYYIRVDFDGFVNIVDELGGIELEVENTLDDYMYPIKGEEDNPDYYARYEHLHIDKGYQKMDGALALKYARSRHALGVEGSDFARSKRQQKVIYAAKEKLLDEDNLLRPGMLARIIGQLNEHLATDFHVWEVAAMWDLFKDVNKDDIINQVFDDGPGGFLVASRGSDGAYILIPKTGNFYQIKTFVQEIFPEVVAEEEQAKDDKDRVMSLETDEKILVEIKNGTNINGLAARVGEALKQAKFTVSKISNASRRDFIEPKIYDLTYGAKDEALEILENVTGAKVEESLPDWLVSEIKEGLKADPKQVRPDFILIVGEKNDQSN